ncbi:MAG: hypothetical protein M0R31_08195 [Candidatus Riflebacteria bacterium]|nr:hypothetical protein [Candidatus Riflebacteria bacterium]
MLFFDYSITFLEVPGQSCLTFYISECQNRCENCHSKELWQATGSALRPCFHQLIELYRKQITCVCFLGEGRNTPLEHAEFVDLCKISHQYGLKTCLYSGRDCEIEEWMKCFDFIKTGSFKEECGPLTAETTNQRLFKMAQNSITDITSKFWNVPE